MAFYPISRQFTGNDAKYFLPDTLVPPDRTVLAIAAFYTSVGNGTRRVHVGLFDKDNNQLWAAPGSRNQGANQTWWYYCANGLPWDDAGNGQDENWIPWPTEYVVPDGGYIRVWDINNAQPVNDNILIRVLLSAGEPKGA